MHNATKIMVDSINLEPIINRMIQTYRWSDKGARKVAALYRNFLYLKKKYGKQYLLPPSVEIDEFWHNHILHTEKYFSDCLFLFGEYLHHSPQHGELNKMSHAELERCFEKETQKLHFAEFGEYIYQVKTKNLWRF